MIYYRTLLMRRRRFLRTTSQLGTILSIASVGFAGCMGHRDPPPMEAYLDDTEQWEKGAPREENVISKTGTERPVISVGAGPENRWFKPQAINITAGTTVVWSWTGKGGLHNVVGSGAVPEFSFDSGQPQETGQFKQTFFRRGIRSYYSEPDEEHEMRGAIGVIGNVPTDTEYSSNENTTTPDTRYRN